MFNRYSQVSSSQIVNYVNVDISKWLYTNNIDVSLLNRVFDVELSVENIQIYKNKNLKILDEMKVNPSSPNFFNQLQCYIVENINKPINFHNW
jgi:hypothetical protein